MQKKFIILNLSLFSLIFFFKTSIVYAVCPVCTVAIGAGLEISRALGIDDVVTSIWIGAMIFSMGLWLYEFLQKKQIKFKYSKLISIAFMYLLTLPFLYFFKIFGLAFNTLWGIDKVLLGIILGTIFFIIGVIIDKLLRTYHEDKAYFPFQKAIIPVSLLGLTSLIMFFITN
ncbi:hypothetical protein GYA19_01910 [Candidatus Beckwithbacteria bacterium]|nr:hypothetical protein [Candidatus Beckwithbacteria bacterium]